MTVEYKNEIYKVETLHFYDEYLSIYKGNLLETESIEVRLSEVTNLALSGVNITEGEYCKCGNKTFTHRHTN